MVWVPKTTASESSVSTASTILALFIQASSASASPGAWCGCKYDQNFKLQRLPQPMQSRTHQALLSYLGWSSVHFHEQFCCASTSGVLSHRIWTRVRWASAAAACTKQIVLLILDSSSPRENSTHGKSNHLLSVSNRQDGWRQVTYLASTPTRKTRIPLTLFTKPSSTESLWREVVMATGASS